MAFSYPVQIDTPWEKVRYLFRLREYLRLLHNFSGLWYREGLTQDQYDNGVDAGILKGKAGQTFILTSQVKSQYPYTHQITKEQLGNFRKNEWERRFIIVDSEIAVHSNDIKSDATYDYLLDLDF